MAQVDTSMYSQQQAPDILGGISQGMKLSQLATQTRMQNKELADQQAVRDAYKGNLTQDENGNMTLNKQGFLSHLAQVNPEKAFEYQKTLAQNERDAQRANLESMKDRLSFATQKYGGVRNQADLDATNAQLKNAGFKDEDLLPTFTPEGIQAKQMEGMTAQQQIDTHMKERGLVNDENKTGIEGRKADNENKNNQAKLKFEYEKEFGRDQGPAAPVTPDTDPATLVRNNVPKSLQKEAFEEIKDAQNIGNIGPKALAAFDRAAVEARPLTGGWKGTSVSALVPSLNGWNPMADDTPAQKAFTGLVNTTIKETEGTARQAAFESVKKNFMPQTGDSDDKIKEKRAAFKAYLASHSSAPIAKSGKIDLSKFKSTTVHDPADDGIDADVAAYAKEHGISTEEAAHIKAQRTSSVARGN